MAKTLTDRPTKPTKSKKGAPLPGGEAPALSRLLVGIGPEDPIAGWIANDASQVEVDRLKGESPALQQLKEGGIRLAAPLVIGGKLVCLLNLGAALYEQELTSMERLRLTQIAGQAISATRVADSMRRQRADSETRFFQDLYVARKIQDALLPLELPVISGWRVSAFSQPAKIVGGDFFDFVDLPDHRLAVIVGDVCNKGIPSALMMAAARSVLRQCAREFVTPDRVLKTANDLLFPDTPRLMFVTCFYAVLNPANGSLQYANAGHTLPYRLSAGVEELNAIGVPLGLMPGMTYEVKETVIGPGERLFLASDGLGEARDAQRAMAGTRRIVDWASRASGEECITAVMAGLQDFTGPDWEQEDDITLVVMDRMNGPAAEHSDNPQEIGRLVTEFELASEPGNERLAGEMVVKSLELFNLSKTQLDRLKTAVSETALNAMEHGNLYQKEKPATFQVFASSSELRIRVVDSGGGRPIPPETHPDLQAKLNGTQSPRGWGLFLIRNMVDEMLISSDEIHHTVELVFSLKGGLHDS